VNPEIPDFIRKQYDHEVDRQDKIVASLSLPTGILTALGTAGATMIRGFSYQLANVTPAFYVLMGFDIVSFASALYFLRKAIQELAGHQDLATTQQYMHLSPAALEAAIRLLESRTQTSSGGNNLEAAGTGSVTA
jgi:hypothetical protein